MPEPTDADLIKQYLKGDEKPLEILIKRYLRPVYGLAFSYSRNQADADDITQEVFVKVWRHIKKFDCEKSFKAWLFTIAKNTSLDFLKKKRAIPFSVFENENGYNFVADSLASQSPSPLQEAEKKEAKSFVSSAIKHLSSNYQKIIFLRHDKDMTFQEIADFLGESINTVKSRYRRAIINIKKIIG
ncbi:MAG: sigma-70 family RNA polymerase sigma factor [Candidatus Paceibacterota bacterium]|jgi:RNA polymerase sigma-70 factor (ECF subfamily)|nr:sigma-70 family RNA polymerase sigma factor [Candidatus Paceibacterota bacterium]MDD4830550.1 sigma-70 family RNA polymerase sigma factor [Candidatus Paceibacterota bacterium]MDD4874781.1 sigma-70 family RNA polymerase sigma factor [Candidatus Paceibacterota bacterium]